MLRYIITAPDGLNWTRSRHEEFMAKWKDVVDDPRWRDVLIDGGFEIRDMRPTKRLRRPYRPALLR